jgi:hypothetical protein
MEPESKKEIKSTSSKEIFRDIRNVLDQGVVQFTQEGDTRHLLLAFALAGIAMLDGLIDQEETGDDK